MAPDMIDEQDMAVESPAEDTMTRRLRQVYLVVLIACAIVEAGVMANVASGRQLPPRPRMADRAMEGPLGS